MNEWVQFLILGAVQGVAEFLPISSDGHLLLAQNYLCIKNQGLFVTVMLHLGTLLATAFYFRKKIVETIVSKDRNPVAISLFVAMIPTGIVALGLKEMEEAGLFTPILTAGLLVFNGCILFVAQRLSQKALAARQGDLVDANPPKTLPTLPQSILIGALQGMAALPGVSRSGSTIAGGLYSGLSAKDAFEYSFLLSLPAVGAALVFELKDIGSYSGSLGPLFFGTVVSGLVGFVALAALKRIVTGGKLHYFGIYCVVVGLGNLIYLLISGGGQNAC